jgi:hypothetical protein
MILGIGTQRQHFQYLSISFLFITPQVHITKIELGKTTMQSFSGDQPGWLPLRLLLPLLIFFRAAVAHIYRLIGSTATLCGSKQ